MFRCILVYLIDSIEESIENLPQEEIGLQNEIHLIELNLDHARNQRKAWDAHDDKGKMRSKLKALKGRLKKKLERSGLSLIQVQELTENIERIQPQIDLLDAERSYYRQAVDDVTEERGKAMKAKKQFRVDRKSEEESLYSQIDKIMQQYGVHRCVYHSGEVNGVGIKRLMEKSPEVMDTIKQLLLEKLQPGSRFTETDVSKLCNDCLVCLILWDSAFSAVHVVDPTEAECDDAQRKIDAAVAHMRRMDMTITPKVHGMESHVVLQMKRTPGGIVKMIEHWVEQYHQVGYNYDDKWRRMRSEEQRALIRAHRENIASHPEIVKRLRLLKERFVGCRGKRASTAEREEDSKRIKKERRENIECLEMEIATDKLPEEDTTMTAAASSLLAMGHPDSGQFEEAEI